MEIKLARERSEREHVRECLEGQMETSSRAKRAKTLPQGLKRRSKTSMYSRLEIKLARERSEQEIVREGLEGQMETSSRAKRARNRARRS